MIEIGDLGRRVKGKVQPKFQKVVLQSNSFLVDISKISSLSIYAVKVVSLKNEAIINEKQRDKIIEKELDQIKRVIHQPIFKSGLMFSQKISKEKDYSIILEKHAIIIREICRFDVLKSPKTLVYFFSNVLRKVMEKLGYIQIARTNKFINMDNKIEIDNLLVYSGFRVSFELLENSLYLNVDTTMKVVRNESVLEFINNLYKLYEGMERDQKRDIVKKNLVNQIIMTNYGKVRYVRVEDVLFTDLSQIVVESYQMLLTEYYRVKYDYKIKNLKQPLICATSSNRKTKLFLIPELCLMTGVPQNIDDSKNKLLTELPRFSAEKRKNNTQNFIKNIIQKEEDQIFTTLGIKIGNSFQKIQAKIMPPPRIVFGKGKCVQPGKQTGFVCQDYEIYRQKSVTKLGVISLDGIDCSTIIAYLYDTCKKINIKLEMVIIKVETCNMKYKTEGLFNLISDAKQKQKCNICLLILPNRMFPYYQKIKQYSVVEKQLLCQIALENTLKKKNFHSISSKILIQILAKVGNSIWASVPKVTKEKIMFIAYYSSETGKFKTNSFTIGICATCQQSNTEIFSKAKRFDHEHEEIQIMKQLFLEALAEYKKRNGSIPQDIIILQNQRPSRSPLLTNKFFVQPINTSMEQYYGNKKPKLTYLLISKPGHHRFYETKKTLTTNPPIGAIIQGKKDDNGYSNFFMVTHGVSKNGGSVIPLNYKIIFTNSDMPDFVLHSFLFSQCFNYFNYSGAIKQPGLLQNVIKCTKFRAQALNNRDVTDSMKMCPYYL